MNAATMPESEAPTTSLAKRATTWAGWLALLTSVLLATPFLTATIIFMRSTDTEIELLLAVQCAAVTVLAAAVGVAGILDVPGDDLRRTLGTSALLLGTLMAVTLANAGIVASMFGPFDPTDGRWWAVRLYIAGPFALASLVPWPGLLAAGLAVARWRRVASDPTEPDGPPADEPP